MKLTEWYPGHIKPVRVGVYQQRCGNGNDIGYQKWDGHQWYSWSSSIDEADAEINIAPRSCQNDAWRGVAK